MHKNACYKHKTENLKTLLLFECIPLSSISGKKKGGEEKDPKHDSLPKNTYFSVQEELEAKTKWSFFLLRRKEKKE